MAQSDKVTREMIVREMIVREIAPMVTQCEEMIRRAESEPIVLDKREREAIRVDAIRLRTRLECLLNDLHSVEGRVIDAADKRWPQWRE